MKLAIGTLFLALCTAPAATQDLGMNVFYDPLVDLVTYEVLVSGPPSGQAHVFGAFAQGDPVAVPGIEGKLQIDPASAMSLGAVPLDSSGLGYLTLHAPASIANGLPLVTQAVLMDVVGQLGFTNLMIGVYMSRAGWEGFPNTVRCRLTYAGRPGLTPQFYSVYVWDAAPGMVAELQVNGAAIGATGTFQVGPNGTTPNWLVIRPSVAQPGDLVELFVDGVLIRQWRH